MTSVSFQAPMVMIPQGVPLKECMSSFLILPSLTWRLLILSMTFFVDFGLSRPNIRSFVLILAHWKIPHACTHAAIAPCWWCWLLARRVNNLFFIGADDKTPSGFLGHIDNGEWVIRPQLLTSGKNGPQFANFVMDRGTAARQAAERERDLPRG